MGSRRFAPFGAVGTLNFSNIFMRLPSPTKAATQVDDGVLLVRLLGGLMRGDFGIKLFLISLFNWSPYQTQPIE